jgi:PKD domain
MEKTNKLLLGGALLIVGIGVAVLFYARSVTRLKGQLDISSSCFSAIAKMSAQSPDSVATILINGNSTSELELVWQDSNEQEFVGYVEWTNGDVFQEEKKVTRPDHCANVPTPTPTGSVNPENVLGSTGSLSITPSLTPTSTIVRAISLTPSITSSPSLSPTKTLTPTVTKVPSKTPTPTALPSATKTPTPVSPVECTGLSVSAASGTAPLTVTFTVKTSRPAAEVQEYEFNFGDDSAGQPVQVIQKEPVLTHRYELAGTYATSVRVRSLNGDWAGVKSACQKTITVRSRPEVLSSTESGTLAENEKGELPTTGVSLFHSIIIATLSLVGVYLYKRFRLI